MSPRSEVPFGNVCPPWWATSSSATMASHRCPCFLFPNFFHSCPLSDSQERVADMLPLAATGELDTRAALFWLGGAIKAAKKYHVFVQNISHQIAAWVKRLIDETLMYLLSSSPRFSVVAVTWLRPSSASASLSCHSPGTEHNFDRHSRYMSHDFRCDQLFKGWRSWVLEGWSLVATV